MRTCLRVSNSFNLVLWWKIERPHVLRVRADKEKCSPSSLGFAEFRCGSLAHLIKRPLHNSHHTYNSKASEWRGGKYNLQPNPMEIWFSNRIYMRCFTGGYWHRCAELLQVTPTDTHWTECVLFCILCSCWCAVCALCASFPLHHGGSRACALCATAGDIHR